MGMHHHLPVRLPTAVYVVTYAALPVGYVPAGGRSAIHKREVNNHPGLGTTPSMHRCITHGKFLGGRRIP